MTDPLVAEMTAHPESDDARLVWADREGGERGELVVVQCALASGAGDRAARRRLYDRERELTWNALAWPELAGLTAPSFERGFLTHARMKLDHLPRLLERHPFLRSVELSDLRVDLRGGAPTPWRDQGRKLARVLEGIEPGRIARIVAEPIVYVDGWEPQTYDHTEELLGALSGTHAGRALRGLALRTSLREVHLAWMAKWAALEELRAQPTFGLACLRDFAATHPNLTRLGLRSPPRAGLEHLASVPHLVELDLSVVRFTDAHLASIAAIPFAGLKKLGIGSFSGTTAGLEAIAGARHLASLEEIELIGPGVDDRALAVLARSTFAPNLRVLRVRDARLTAAALPDLAGFPKLERLDARTAYGSSTALDPAREVIPWVAL